MNSPVDRRGFFKIIFRLRKKKRKKNPNLNVKIENIYFKSSLNPVLKIVTWNGNVNIWLNENVMDDVKKMEKKWKSIYCR